MGSQAMQGKLWGQKPTDWADIQEPTGRAGYDFVLNYLSSKQGLSLLDAGCGTGYFCKMADDLGVEVTGMDASAEFIEIAKKRAPGAVFLVGELEELPFDDHTFDVVCGFNSFQYAENTYHALVEARRVLKPRGKLAVMIWGNKEDCETATYIAATGSLMPPPPPGARGPFSLSEHHLLENILQEAGFKIISTTDVLSVWDYPDTGTALKGLLSTGVAARVIAHAGFEQVYDTSAKAVAHYVQTNGHVIYRNKFRVVIAEK
jgi:ubiquinone/menaquinone biosynthesis C-methylase UbiE